MTSDYETKRDEAAMECMNKYHDAAFGGTLVLAPVFSGFCNGADWARENIIASRESRILPKVEALEARLEIYKESNEKLVEALDMITVDQSALSDSAIYALRANLIANKALAAHAERMKRIKENK